MFITTIFGYIGLVFGIALTEAVSIGLGNEGFGKDGMTIFL